MRTDSPGHLKTFDYVGRHRYSLTFCTNSRRAIFTSVAVVDLVLDQFLRAATETGVAVIAYCFMPDHVHLLVEGDRDDADCLRFISRAKQYSGFYYARQCGAALWQRYGFEHVLRDDELTLVVARYMVRNPVRAGLVQDVSAYPYWGSSVYSREQLLDAIGAMPSAG